MIKVGITGIDGFLGWHLRCFLYTCPGIEIVPCGRSVFADFTRLKSFAASCDVIVHLAGVNRGSEPEISQTNVKLAADLIKACDESGSGARIIFASTIHILRKSVYGQSKKRCTELFKKWSRGNKGKFTNLIVPNLFGECGKPFYNSVIATFCYQISHGLKAQVISDSLIELTHAQDIAQKIYQVIVSGAFGNLRIYGRKIRVRESLERIKSIAALYQDGLIPDLSDPFDLNLFNTYRSYLYPAGYPVKIDLHADNRGRLFETVKAFSAGQSFISVTKPLITRGEHFHIKKLERFILIRGQALLRIRKLFSNEVTEFRLNELECNYVDIPTLHTHNITNTGKSELLVLFWSNQIYNQDNADTYPEKV